MKSGKLVLKFIKQDDKLKETIFRVVGQAIASGHMKEHSIIASDYAVKVINLLPQNDLQKIKEEREWQLQTLLELVKKR